MNIRSGWPHDTRTAPCWTLIYLLATFVNDDPANVHAVEITITLTFKCGIDKVPCCLDSKEVQASKKEKTECQKSHDVSNARCDGYSGDWCGVHIRQYQKNEARVSTRDYRFDVTLHDGDQELFGE
jgi:hypothetical protein